MHSEKYDKLQKGLMTCAILATIVHFEHCSIQAMKATLCGIFSATFHNFFRQPKIIFDIGQAKEI